MLVKLTKRLILRYTLEPSHIVTDPALIGAGLGVINGITLSHDSTDALTFIPSMTVMGGVLGFVWPLTLSLAIASKISESTPGVLPVNINSLIRDRVAEVLKSILETPKK